jgi:hypothetical protein
MEENMSLQQIRSIAFLVTTVLVSVVYVVLAWSWYGDALARSPEDRAMWAGVILVYVPVQVVARLLVHIVVAVVHAARGAKEPVDLEDEMDKAIDRRITVIVSTVILVCLLAALGTQLVGWPLSALFLTIGGSIMLGGVIGDLTMVVLYRRGV